MNKADNFQKLELRYKDVLVKKIMNLGKLPSISDWRDIKLELIKKTDGVQAWKIFKKNILNIFFLKYL